MTAEEIAALVAQAIEAATPKFLQLANDAATAHTKRVTKDFDAKLADFKPVTTITEPVPDGKSKTVTPELAAMSAKLEDTLKRFDIADKARILAEEKQRDGQTMAQLKEALKAVRPDMVDTAAKLLFHVDKRISYDEAGNPLFTVKRAPIPGMAEEDVPLPLAAGVEQWLKTKDASPFVASPAAGGPGGRGGKSPLGVPTGRNALGMPKYDGPATTDDEKVARAAENERALTKAMEQAGL